MNNSYLIAGVIVLVAILGFVFASKRTDAPVTTNENNNIATKQGSIADGTYTIDTAKSVIKWTGEFVVGISENGTINLSSGSATAQAGVLTQGNFVIDMKTIADSAGKQRLTDHLKSEDFFAIATYPTATFVLKTFASTSAEGALLGRFVIGGDLTIKGITKPISFMATVVPTPDGLSAKSSFAINRADWEIKYNSPSFFQNLGDKAIRDAVQIELDLSATKSE